MVGTRERKTEPAERGYWTDFIMFSSSSLPSSSSLLSSSLVSSLLSSSHYHLHYQRHWHHRRRHHHYFYHHSILPCVCSIIDHGWRQNAVRTKKKGTQGAARSWTGVLGTPRRLLCSVTEQIHSNMFYFVAKRNIVHGHVINASVYQ